MAMDTFIVFAASYDTLGAAEADYHAVREFYLTSGLLDTYDAAVITRDETGKVKIVVKHEQPTRQGAWRGLGIGLVGGGRTQLRGIRGGEGEAAQRVMISKRVNPPRQVRPAKGWPWTSGRWS
jgi:hypothetical protein